MFLGGARNNGAARKTHMACSLPIVKLRSGTGESYGAAGTSKMGFQLLCQLLVQCLYVPGVMHVQ